MWATAFITTFLLLPIYILVRMHVDVNIHVLKFCLTVLWCYCVLWFYSFHVVKLSSTHLQIQYRRKYDDAFLFSPRNPPPPPPPNPQNKRERNHTSNYASLKSHLNKFPNEWSQIKIIITTSEHHWQIFLILAWITLHIFKLNRQSKKSQLWNVKFWSFMTYAD